MGLSALLFAIGCTDGRPAKQVDDSWTVQRDARDTSGGSSSADATDDRTRPSKSQPVRFRLVNQTEEPVQIQTFRNCMQGDWMEFQNDQLIYGKKTCPTCRCQTLREGEECFRCEDGRCEGPDVDEIAPGESVEWLWTGLVFQEGEVASETCYRQQVPYRRAEMTVQMCWGGVLGHGVLSSQECAEKTFEYGQTSEVEHVIVD